MRIRSFTAGHIGWFMFALFSYGAAFGQGYMNDQSSTYIDSWGSSAGIYGYGATDGQAPIHEYAVDVSISSPRGRRVSSTGVFGWGFVSNTILMAWDSSDLGDYEIRTEHRGWCSLGEVLFTLAWEFLIGKVGARQTYYKDPVPDAPYPGSCLYLNKACSSGTPTCTEGFVFVPEWECPPYVLAEYLTYTRFFYTSCFKIAPGVEAPEPGPCT